MSFSSIKIEGRQATPDRVYYNGTIINNSKDTTIQADDPEIRFQDTRQVPIIADASNYEVSVENFSLNGATKNFPLLIPIIADPSTNVDETVYTVSFGVYTGTTGDVHKIVTVPLIWVTENNAKFTEKPALGPIQLETDYYYCYSYTHWISIVNTALRTAWQTAKTDEPTIGTQCPWFEFDETTGLFSINQDSKTCMTPVGTALSQPYNVTYAPTATYLDGEYSFVGMNTNLENLLTNFCSIYYSVNQPWNLTSEILPEIVIDMGLPRNLLDNTILDENTQVGISLRTVPKTSIFLLANPFDYTPITSAVFVRLVQDFASTGTMWSPVASFVLATTQIPVRNEQMANPIILGQANIGDQQASSGSFQKVLIETPINALTADIWKGWVLYEPLIPKYSALDPSHDGIQNIDINIYWRNRLTNALIPVRLPNQGSVSFRLMFKKRISCVKSA
jgi:hypothetical protein